MAASPEEVWKEVRGRLQERYVEVKQAFKLYDDQNNQTVTVNEFRRVLETFCMPGMTQGQFDALMTKVEIKNNGTIDYGNFLDRIVGRPNSEVLRSHNLGGKDMSMYKADTLQVERELKEKLQSQASTVLKACTLYDFDGNGKVLKHEIRLVLENYGFKLKDTQFDKLWYKHSDNINSNSVNYRDFLTKIGVTLPRSSSSAALGSGGGNKRPLGINDNDRKFIQKGRQNYSALRKSLISGDRLNDGYISVEEAKSVLFKFAGQIPHSTMEKLLNNCRQKDGGRKIHWLDLLSQFDSDQDGLNNSNNVDPFVVNKSGVIDKFTKAVLTQFPSARQCFLKYDEAGTGKLTRLRLRQMISDLNLHLLEPEEVRALYTALDPESTNIIHMNTFIKLVDPGELTSRGGRGMGQPENRSVNGMTWETNEIIMRDKLTDNMENVVRDLTKLEKNGRVRPRDLRSISEKYAGIRIDDQHWDRIMSVCGEDKTGQVLYVDFFFNIGIDANFVNQVRNKVKKQNNQLTSQSVPNINQSRSGSGEAVFHALEQLTTEVPRRHREYYASFRKCDPRASGYVSLADMQRVLFDMNIYITNKQLETLLKLLDLQHNGFKVNYSEFLDAVRSRAEEQRFQNRSDAAAAAEAVAVTVPSAGGGAGRRAVSGVGPLPRGGVGTRSQVISDASNGYEEYARGSRAAAGMRRVDSYQASHPPTYPNLNILEVMEKLKAKMLINYKSITSALETFDKGFVGEVKNTEFRRIIDNFCFVLSDKQYTQLASRLSDENGMINYRVIMDSLDKNKSMPFEYWIDDMRATLGDTRKNSELHNRIKSKVSSNYRAVSNAFHALDYANMGVIGKSEFNAIFNQHIFPISQSQFDALYEILPVNSFNNLLYPQFLKKYSDKNIIEQNQDSGGRVSHAAGGDGGRGIGNAVESPGRIREELSAELTEKMKPAIFAYWRGIRRNLENIDTANTGFVYSDQFYELMGKYGVSLSSQEQAQINSSYGDSSGDKIMYSDLIHHFINNLKPKEAAARAQ